MNEKVKLRLKRHSRVRAKVRGTAKRPRLNVYRSAKHIYAQVIDDDLGTTVAAASTVEKAMREANVDGGNVDGAKRIGTLIAERAKERGFTSVVFDRGGWQYHGRVKALADAARAGGLEF